MQSLSIHSYTNQISEFVKQQNEYQLNDLYDLIIQTKINKNNVFICGNGGSGANANHIATDFMYIKNQSKKKININVESLAANTSTITCIANDIGYDEIFSFQIDAKAKKNDLLIVLSGSGNSKNIIKAIKVAKRKKMQTFGIIGFSGGNAKKYLDKYIHFKINDMQIVEDLQTIVFHIIIKKLLFR